MVINSTELNKGCSVIQETRGYNVATNQTFRLRTKETYTDYRYMPESDLPLLIITKVIYDHLYFYSLLTCSNSHRSINISGLSYTNI